MAVARFRVKLLAKYVSMLALVYFLIAIVVTMTKTDEVRVVSEMLSPKAYKSYNTPVEIHINTPKSCQELHIASVGLGPRDVQPFVQMLKTVLYFHDNPLVFHIVTNNPTKHIMSTLFNTWSIPGLTPYFYTTNSITDKTTNLEALGIKLKLHSILPSAVREVIVLDSPIRFTSNLFGLWKEFDLFTNQTAVGIHRTPGSSGKGRYMPDILLLKLTRWRAFLEKYSLPLTMTASWDNVHSWFETHPALVRQLPCEWQVRLQANFNTDECLQGNKPLAFWWDKNSATYTANPEIEQLKMIVQSVEHMDGELLRHTTSPCYKVPYEVYDNLASTCGEFRYASRIKRRTHLYIYGDYQPGAKSNDPYDITLVTQLTPDRFEVLERMATQWDGPLHAVFHVSEAESLKLPTLAQQSKLISKRNNIAFHAVFKRGVFYPINYLRNVGINQSVTPYTLFVDVDLVPNNLLYKSLKKYIPTHMNQPKQTLVVPSFEAHKPLPEFPNTKDALLKLMTDKTVEGYRMSRGWNLGHKPTNYPKWRSATEPYKAEFADAFEPYMVLETKTMPRFEETLLERMGDKLAYGRIMYAMGYQFIVIPDQFVIHLPHAESKGTNMWKTYPGYGRCSGILFEEFRKATKQKYPWQKVH